MFGLLKRKPVLEVETVQWLIETYSWALKNFGNHAFYEKTILVTPSDKHFPAHIKNNQHLAQSIFDQVKQHAGMSKWDCNLVAQEADVNPIIAPTLLIRNTKVNPAGTFSMARSKQRKAIITYDPSQVKDPEMLVATFAHELGHYLSHRTAEPPPGGKALWEPATDLLAVFMGFGIFLANSAYSFQQYTGIDSQGWSSQSRGYLNQYELTYALAIFAVLKENNKQEIEKYLKNSLRAFYKQAIKELQHNHEALNPLKYTNI